MKKLFIVILMSSALLAFGQQAKTPTEKPLPVSHDMRKIGLLYLDYIDKMFNKANQEHLAWMGDPLNNEETTPEENVYGKALTNLEESTEIDIKLPGDKKFLGLLENTKTYAIIAYHEVIRNADPAFKSLPQNPELAKMYPTCVGQAHGIISTGVFIRGDCSPKKENEAIKADKALQEKQSEAKP
jgi:hypothetical protein